MNQEVQSTTVLDATPTSIRVALVGSPNSGKTTLFNALTGSRQKTGNYPGVTVERKQGLVSLGSSHETDTIISILDLPGIYSLTPKSPDELVATQVLQGEKHSDDLPEIIIAVADSLNLERNLYLVSELRELGIPMVLALSMTDLANKAGMKINVRELERRLGVPVVEISAVRGHGLRELINKVLAIHLEQLLARREAKKSPLPVVSRSAYSSNKLPQTQEFIQARYRFVESLVRDCVQKQAKADRVTEIIDRVVLHPVAGPVILVLLFGLLFQLMFTAAELPMTLLEDGVAKLGSMLESALPESVLRDLLVNGVVAGVGSVVVFLPQILILFAFIITFEDSGYMARAAFILDRLMSQFGLNGRAFIPMLSSFACAIPGVMATRTIESRRDRLITILIAPLMTCSARLPIYTMMIGAFIPTVAVFGGIQLPVLVMFALYAIAVFAALMISLILGRTVLKGATTPFVIELPSYKVPSLKNIGLALYDRARVFLKRAGTVILALSILLWALATYPKVDVPVDVPAEQAAAYQMEHSFMGRLGHMIEPVVEPLGFDWKIGAGLISSFAAREVLVSTLGTIYAVEADDSEALSERLKSAVNPKTGLPVFTIPTVLSLLVFYMFACQCMSTIAVVRRETNSWVWPGVMFGYMTLLAYVAAFVTYRLATWLLN